MEEVLVVHGFTLVMTLVAAVTDFRTGHIPNWLTLPPMVVAPIVFGVLHGIEGFLMSAIGMVVCGAVPYLMFRLTVRTKGPLAGAKEEGQKAMHGGDVKLFIAIGAVTGVFLGIEAQLLAMIVAGIYALARLAWNGQLFRTVGNSFFVVANPVLPEKWRRDISKELLHPVRLGVPIFIGTALAIADKHPMLLMP